MNGCPIELLEPEILRLKTFEPVLLLGQTRFANVDIRIRRPLCFPAPSPRGKMSPRVALGLLYEPCVPLEVIAEGLGRWAWPRRASGACAGHACCFRWGADLDL